MSNQTINRDKNTISLNKIKDKFISVDTNIYTEKRINKESSSIHTNIRSLANATDIQNNFIIASGIKLRYEHLERTESKSIIKEYFLQKPSVRAQKRKEYAAYIKSIEDVFKVLELGNTRNIKDAYDSAVDILAECNKDIIIEAFDKATKKYISNEDEKVALNWEKNWEILIKGITYSLKIEISKKMSLILFLCNFRNSLSRLTKLTIIDSIVDLDIDTDIAEVMLQLFMSSRELDDFVRKYAQKQASECL